MTKPKRVVVTGAAGQISYSLLFRIANGDLLGPHQPIILSLLELPVVLESLKGVVMELEDCAFPLLYKTEIHSEPERAYEGADYALLVGAKPRGPGMERKDLLKENGKIFVEQGRAINRSASRDIRVLVVGNPCNTNCLVTLHNAPDISPKNFFAMMRLDQNRAQSQLAQKAGVHHSFVDNLIVWGNHSATQVPDFTRATIDGRPVEEVIGDRHWLEKDFFSIVQQRGAHIIQARGKSSAASAAAAAIDTIAALQKSSDQLFSMGVISNDNPYGIQKDLIFSFPLKCPKPNHWEIQRGFAWDSFIEEKIKMTERELLEERDMVKDLLK